MRWTILFAACALFAAMTGCEDRTTVGGGDPSTHPSLGAAIEVSESRLDFELLDAGAWRGLALDIHSVGTGNLYLGSLTIDGSAAFTIDGDDTAHAIAPGDHTTVHIRFEPLADGMTLGALHIASNDPDDPDLAVELAGTGMAPRIQLSPASWDYGEADAGCPHEQVVEITNIGSKVLVVEDVDVSASSDELSYTWLFFEGTSLQPGESHNVTVTYEPRDEMPDTGYLYVTSNDPTRPEVMAVQHGVGLISAPVVDEFQPAAYPATDILWVIDNSCSMADDQTSLASNFNAFLEIADSMQLDYHLGVVTTDDGHLQGAIPIMTPSTPDLHAAFAAAVTVGTMGSANEKGFQYAWEAVGSPLADPGGPNDGFLRDEAGLRIIFLSDEAEQSAETVEDYVDNFRSRKANPNDVILSCIIEQNYGQRYEQAAAMTGGLVEYLSNPNWANTMSELAWLSVNHSYYYPLSQVPVEGTVEVRINGVPVHEGWSLDTVNHAVAFDPDHIPDGEDLISVIYHPIGDC